MGSFQHAKPRPDVVVGVVQGQCILARAVGAFHLLGAIRRGIQLYLDGRLERREGQAKTARGVKVALMGVEGQLVSQEPSQDPCEEDS